MAYTTILPTVTQALNCSGNDTDCLEEEYKPYGDRPETYIVPVVFLIILVVGVTGNGVLVLIIVRHANMRNVPNTYILSLAIGDLLVILTCVPFTFTVYVIDSWPFGLTLCKISECFKDISTGVSVFTLTALSADRFFAIVDPMRKLHATGGGKRISRLTIVVAISIWILAILCATPATFAYIRSFRVNKDFSFKTCYLYPVEFGSSYPRIILICRFFIYYALPLSTIAVFYMLMARHLIQSTRKIPGEMQGQQIKQVKSRKKVAKMVMAFVVIFAVCFFPQHVFMLWFYIYPTAEQDYNGYWHAFRILGFCLAFMNSCINPIALYCVSGSFRKYFNRYLLCCFLSENHRVTSTDIHRRGKSFSLTTSRRQISSRRGQKNIIHQPTWPINMEARTKTAQKTTVITAWHNGLDQKI